MARAYPTMIDRLGSAAVTIGGQLAKVSEQVSVVPASSTISGKKVWTYLRLVFGLLCAVTALCVTAIGYGRINRISDPVTRIGLDRCDGTLCFMDVAPGWTNWTEAKSDLARIKHNRMFEHQIYVPIGSDGGAVLYPSLDGQTVGLVYIAIPSDISLRVGDIVSHFGPPCLLSVPIRSDDPTLILYYPRLTITTKISNNYLAIDTPVTHIALNDPAELPNKSINSCQVFDLKRYLAPPITRPWRGFASISRYLGNR